MKRLKLSAKGFKAAIASAVAAVTLFASGAASVKEARAKFEKEHGGAFMKSTLFDQGAADSEARFDKAAGKSAWSIVLPYSDDSRVRFIAAEFENGKYVKGEIFVFGFAGAALSAADFAALKSGFPMIAVRTDKELKVGSDAKALKVAVLYPVAEKYEEQLDVEMRNTSRGTLNAGVLAGALGNKQTLDRLGIQVGTLKYRASFVGADQMVVDLGVVQAKTSWNGLEASIPGVGGRGPKEVKSVIESLREAMAKRDGKAEDHISDRDVVDYWVTGKYTFKGEK